MHFVMKTVKGREYYYLIAKERRGKRVVTTQTIYIGDRLKVAELLQQRVATSFPESYVSQEVGGSLALADVARDLGIEELIDAVCPVRAGAVPVGRQLLLIALHRALAPRWGNSKTSLEGSYKASALSELLPLPEAALDNRRLDETLASLTRKQVEDIECAVVQRLVEHEGVGLEALAFDTTNFDSYAAASTHSRLLRRGHPKSGRPLRVLGLGLLVTEDEGLPLLTFAYPGNENDVTAFARFLEALDRRRSSLKLPVNATIAADGGNISKKILKRLEAVPRHYILRLPVKHAVALGRPASRELPALTGTLRGKVRARKQQCAVYGVERCVVDAYSRRMHRRQLPGLQRDWKKARADLEHLQRQLENQRHGRRLAKPITVTALRRRVSLALAREHMTELFRVRIEKADGAPRLHFEEVPEAWKHLENYVLGRTLLVTNRTEWSEERIILASRRQSENERFFRDVKDPGGVSMLPLRHRRDAALRANALCVVLGLILAKVLRRRLRAAGVKATGISSLLRLLKSLRRARLQLPSDASPALRAFAKSTWVPSQRTDRQSAVLEALKLDQRPELGTTLFERKPQETRGSRAKKAR